MSDPPKKLGSLRDRIAAFENKGSAAPPPPAPRPKPAGGASWKPRARSPPLSPPTSDTGHGADKAAAGMSAADAKVSIGQGGSLKERMAALQGLNAFGGGSSLPPKPATEKPKWKPPPVVAAPVDDENDDEEKPKAATSDAHAHAEAEEEQRQGSEETERPAQEEAQGEPDPEEEERQRRAAIAARLARLGGARVGMAPPMFGKKPEVKKPEAPKDEVEKPSDVPQSPTAVSPPSVPSVSVISGQGEDARAGASEGKDPALLSPSPEAATAVKSPSSMPVPAAPRRAAPPRKRAAKSPSPSPAIVLEEGVVNQSPSPIPGTTPDQAITTAEPAHGDREPEVRESQVEPLLEKMHVTESEATAQAQEPAAEGERALGHVATAEHAHDTDLESGNHQATSPGSGEHITVQSEDVTPHSSSDDMPTPEDTVVVPAEYVHTSAVPSSEPEQLEEEDEEARRKRIAERLAKAGGINH